MVPYGKVDLQSEVEVYAFGEGLPRYAKLRVTLFAHGRRYRGGRVLCRPERNKQVIPERINYILSTSPPPTTIKTPASPCFHSHEYCQSVVQQEHARMYAFIQVPGFVSPSRSILPHSIAGVIAYAAILQVLGGLVRGALEAFRCGALGEEAGKDGLDDGAEHDGRATVRKAWSAAETLSWGIDCNLLCLGKSHVHDEDELEGPVEGEPVGCVDERLNDGQGCIDDPVLSGTC